MRFPGAGVQQASWGARRGRDEERLPLSFGSMGPGCLRNSGELGAQPAALGTAPQPAPCAKFPSKCRLSIAKELYVPLPVIVSQARLFQLRCVPKPEATKGGGQKSRAGQGWGSHVSLDPQAQVKDAMASAADEPPAGTACAKPSTAPPPPPSLRPHDGPQDTSPKPETQSVSTGLRRILEASLSHVQPPGSPGRRSLEM